jgi:gliding motility-associated-like protein
MQALVVAGKMNPFGNDLRIKNVSGNNLSFWIEEGTENTTNTKVWVNTAVGLVSDSIYLFYGNNAAVNVSNGATTFELFDTFNGNQLNAGVWNSCGNLPTVVSGSIAIQNDSYIKSNATFTDTIIAETRVNSINSNKAFFGLVNSSNTGWGMTREISGANELMKLNSISSGSCISLSNQTSINAVSSGNINGIWSFLWEGSNSIKMTWPGGNESRMDPLQNAIFSQGKQVIFGVSNVSGGASLAWVRARKYATIQPLASVNLQEETQLIKDLSITSTGPYCEGEAIQLMSPMYIGAAYAWTGPNGFFNTNQNPTINNATALNTGWYKVSVSNVGGCSPVTDSIEVIVFPFTNKGIASADLSVCELSNGGTLKITSKVGDVLEWESSATGQTPWNSITNTTDSLVYSNLTSTIFFRAKIKSGTCPEVASDVIQVNVSEATIGGDLLGASIKCESHLIDSLRLVNNRGTIINWESSIDNGSTWNIVTNSLNYNTYSGLLTTTNYRVNIKNGVCPNEYSDISTITVNKKPTIGFFADTVCLGNRTSFTDTTKSNNGTINNYTWDFNDGAGSSVKNPNYEFSQSGIYNVKLTATNTLGCIDSLRKNVKVSALPTVNFSAQDVCDQLPVIFQNQSFVSGGTIQQYDWNFGDQTGIYNPQDTAYVFNTEGVYTVNLTAISNGGCIDSIKKNIQIFPRAVVDFIADSVCLGESILFNNTTQTTSTTINYSWNFGDGNSSTITSPLYTYLNAGTYNVNLQSNVPGGCVDSKIKTVVIYPDPIANYSFTDECLYDSITFINQSSVTSGTINYLWDFGDGNVSNLEDVKHKYSVQGSYNVNLLLTSDFGCTSAVTKIVKANPVPVANFSIQSVCKGFDSDFINSSTISSGTNTFEWDFDDGENSMQTNPAYEYMNDGVYNVSLVVNSNLGCSDTIVRLATVFPLPVTDFTSTVACDGDPTIFTNNSTINVGQIISYNWNFDDGTNSIVNDPTHQYLNPGSYNVKLTAISNNGCIKDTTIVTNVSDFPVANFTVDNECDGTSISPLNTSTLDGSTSNLSYVWFFGDGNSFPIENPIHNYDSPGIYPLKLVATSNLGCVDSVTKFVQIYPSPTVEAGLDTNVSQGFSVQLEGFSLGGDQYFWSPLTGLNNSDISNPIASPLETTTYELLVIDVNGCKSTDSLTVEVINDYKLFIHNIITPDGNGINDKWKITNIETFESATVFIYDRWGKEVIKIQNYQNDWEGVDGTDQLPDGTYYYVVTFNDNDRAYKGAVTVLRNK